MSALARPLAALAAAFLAAASLGLPAAAQAAGSQGTAARRALLSRGADSVKGLPFFPPNALSALVGSYALAGLSSKLATGPAAAPFSAAVWGLAEARVWYTRESLVLGSAWRRTDLGGRLAYSLAQAQRQVLLLREEGYYLFFEFSRDLESEDPRRGAFALAFERKFQAFFQNASGDAELSFPAFVEF